MKKINITDHELKYLNNKIDQENVLKSILTSLSFKRFA